MKSYEKVDVIEDSKLNTLIKKKNLSDARIEQYELVLTDIYNITKKINSNKKGLIPVELIEEARIEQRPNFKEGFLLDLDERKITKYFDEYYLYLKDERGNKDSSIKTKLKVLKSFYNYYKIECPDLPNLESNISRIRKSEIPSIKDIRDAFNKIENLKYKAIILFLSSSGMRSGDVVKLTLGNFLEATTEYHDGTLENLLEQDSNNVIPSWYLEPAKTVGSGNICITFNTPECVQSIFNYLEHRIQQNLPVNDNSPLFRSDRRENNHFYESKSLSRLFNESINPLVGGNKDRHGYTFFRPHNLRKFFITTCRAHIGEAMFEVNEYSNEPLLIDFIAVLAGHRPPKGMMTSVYDAIETEQIKPYYLHLTKYLSIGEIIPKDIKSAEYIEMENRVKEAENNTKNVKKQLKSFYEEFGEDIKEIVEERKFIHYSNEIDSDDIVSGILNEINAREAIDLENYNLIESIYDLIKSPEYKKMPYKDVENEINKLVNKINFYKKKRLSDF